MFIFSASQARHGWLDLVTYLITVIQCPSNIVSRESSIGILTHPRHSSYRTTTNGALSAPWYDGRYICTDRYLTTYMYIHVPVLVHDVDLLRTSSRPRSTCTCRSSYVARNSIRILVFEHRLDAIGNRNRSAYKINMRSNRTKQNTSKETA